ncbi:bifunctional diaminohydroxyphosphoribosylaminopyrimidine deaminase/5-amino-6-(5-phosphoribosylamino)uracil reductase RibD [Candidatus Sumerlaeota bacterium]|nr:bifunctional diaminohydroxyphosphoribosylaminopyrimidine deaminase/5-amino-6-(5-phosphoribosylamino)uracil reductase RibD [Candidatus Sumerlaeota bacterium]
MSHIKFSPLDKRYMKRALSLAEKARGRTSPNPMVGAVIAKGNSIIAEAYHKRAGLPHAEIIALRKAGLRARNATLYVTLEPCTHYGRTPPCVDAIIQAGIKRVVVATKDPNPLVNGKGIIKLRRAGIQVDCGLFRTEAQKLNVFFFTYHQKRRPFIILKWAMSLDGRTSTDYGESKWITNEQSRHYVHQCRSQVDALLVGINTVLQDDPLLNVRLKNYRGRQPKRIILDYFLRIPDSAQCIKIKDSSTWVITHSSASPGKIKRLEKQGVRVVRIAGHKGKIRLDKLMEFLYGEQIISMMVEGGRLVAGDFIRHRFVDKIMVFIAPILIGGEKLTAPLITPAIRSITNALRIREIEVKRFGSDVCIEANFRGQRGCPTIQFLANY